MARRGRSVAGPILIAVGLLMLLVQLGFSGMALIWILAILGVGITLLVLYSQGRRHPAVLAGGVWLVLLGLHLLFIRLDWVSLSKSLPFFVMAPGLALLAVAASDRHNKDALTPAIILLGLSVLGFFWTLGVFRLLLDILIWIIKMLFKYVLPLALIAWGAWVVFRQRNGEPDDEFAPFPEKIEPEEMAAAAARATEAMYATEDEVLGDVGVVGVVIEVEEGSDEAGDEVADDDELAPEASSTADEVAEAQEADFEEAEIEVVEAEEAIEVDEDVEEDVDEEIADDEEEPKDK